MKYIVFVVALLFAPAARAQSLEDLAWLTGCWRTQGDRDASVTEVWVAPPMPAMLGYSYTLRDGVILTWEQTRIEVIDGALNFVAMPEGAPSVRFRMREPAQANRVWFDNPEHDFPQTVSYARQGDALTAMVSGAAGENPVTFEYRRIRCPGSLRP